MLGKWTDLPGGRAFQLVEADDPKSIFLSNLGWTDLCRIEATPVLPLESARLGMVRSEPSLVIMPNLRNKSPPCSVISEEENV